MGYSNYYNFSTVYMGKDENGYICIPRGLKEKVIDECKSTGIEYDIEDCCEKGRPIRFSFNGDLIMICLDMNKGEMKMFWSGQIIKQQQQVAFQTVIFLLCYR